MSLQQVTNSSKTWDRIALAIFWVFYFPFFVMLTLLWSPIFFLGSLSELCSGNGTRSSRIGFVLISVSLLAALIWLLSATSPPSGPVPNYGDKQYVRTNDPGVVKVRTYVRNDGTPVISHFRTTPDSTTTNNWSEYPNVNPYTGKTGEARPAKNELFKFRIPPRSLDPR